MTALNVRAKGMKNPGLPEFLYQELPVNAIPFMATMPRGPWAVSIPGESCRNGGYTILKAPPLSADGVVIVYARKPNGRYEAETVFHRKKSYGLEDFADIAMHWVAQNAGIIRIQAERHAYFVPSIEEWNVVLRDSGYVARDPSNLTARSAAAMRGVRQGAEDSGVICRIPICIGDRQSPDDALPVFARVEVAEASDAPGNAHWVSFPEYQRIRECQSAPPDSFAADFQEWIGSLGENSGLTSWVFHPGMLFGDPMEWWSDGYRRRTQHEGVDFAEGVRPGFGICRIPEGTPVGSILEGESVAVLDDFLAKTIVVRHSTILNAKGDVFYTLFSHIQPVAQRLGFVAKGQILGCIGKSTKARAPAHLHLTGAWIPETISPDSIRMHHIHPGCARVVLVNFNGLIKAIT